jgi:hypothetical protein
MKKWCCGMRNGSPAFAKHGGNYQAMQGMYMKLFHAWNGISNTSSKLEAESSKVATGGNWL